MAYPEIGETLAPGAQEVYLSDPYLNGAAEYRVLIAGKLEPSGQIGVWAGAYNTEQNVLMGIQPVNEAAVVSMPDAAPDGGEPLEVLQRLASSEAVKVAVECVK